MAEIKAPTNTGKRVNELIIKSRLSPEEATRRVLGNLQDQFSLPQGATILSSSINDLVYRDAQGFTHRIQRQGDANSPDFGRVSELGTDRPAVLPLTDQIPGLSGALQGAINSVNSLFGGGLMDLSPEEEANLAAISQAERDLITEESQRTQGELVTQLFGRGIEKSDIATGASADFAKALGIVLGQQASGAAQRKLDLQKFLTELTTGTGLNLLTNITGQETTRATEGARIGLGKEQLNQQAEEASRNFLLQWEKFRKEQERSKLPGILSSVASLATLIPGIGPFVAGGLGLGGLLKGKNSSPITGAGSQYPEN